MGGVRPAEFWTPYYVNTQMLDLVKRKLKNEPTIFEVAEPFIQKIKQGTLLVIEFVAPLSRFCKAIVDWYDESQLLELTRDQVRAVYRVIRAIKNTLEEFKSTIISRNVKIENPLEWFNFYMDDINDSHSRFKILVEALLRQAEQATIELDNNDDTGQSSRARTIDESFPSKIDVADRKGSPPRRFLDSESESDESDDDAHPFRSGQKRPARNRDREDKPDIKQSTISGAPDLAATGLESSPAIEDEEKKQPGSFARKSRRSTSKIPKSEFETDTPKLWKDESESEEVQQEAASRAIEESKANLMSTYELGADVLGDLWITHELIKSSIHFVVTDKIKEQNFKLPKIDHLTHPRSQLQGLLSAPPTTDEGDEMKALPMELLIVIEIQIENNHILDDPQDYFKLTINRNALLVHKTHLEGSTLRMIIPVNPDFLKLGNNTIKAKLPRATSQRTPKTLKGRITIGIVTMLSEKQIFAESIGAPCSNRRTTMLANRSGVTGGVAQTDPIEGGIIRCPVRGTGCGHVQCFELFGYIQRNKCKSDWICPVPNCSKSCRPFFELEFDNWVFGNNRTTIDNLALQGGGDPSHQAGSS
ncbi:hypothetical protein MJO28_014291 [Puccinia striiformis f. sp. tritici]|uniref:Uncharacterized protein n=1 Tax=Puccinia striiformis f. sp. tritici TaxID=168172 RepID=A0ACC0DTC5_9BASI|nr:hypothetical protein MJO28_014291 [Puccinia striiformis f. sp. tritici]